MIDCIEHTQKGRSGGYGGTTWKGRSTHLHVKAYCVANGLEAVPAGLCVRHKCDNPRCINPDHLELGTHADNMNDRNVRGRAAKGSRHGRAVIDEGVLLQVRELLAAGATQRDIAARFNISQRTVCRINRKETWKHVA